MGHAGEVMYLCKREKTGNSSLEGLLVSGLMQSSSNPVGNSLPSWFVKNWPSNCGSQLCIKTRRWKPGLPGARSSVGTWGNPEAELCPGSSWWLESVKKSFMLKAIKVQGIPRCLQQDHKTETKPKLTKDNKISQKVLRFLFANLDFEVGLGESRRQLLKTPSGTLLLAPHSAL